jgi:S1-C subfamily serine protease
MVQAVFFHLVVDRPRDDVARRLFGALVKVQTRAVPNARSSASLGTEREGTGTGLGEGGLIVTNGYLIVEADEVKVIDSDGRTLPARVVGYTTPPGSASCARSRR